MDKATFSQLLDKYDDGLLSADEQRLLDKAIMDNTSYAEDFQFHKEVISGIKSKGRKDKLYRLDQYRSEVRAEDKATANKVNKLKSVLLFSAGLIAIISMYLFYTNNQSDESQSRDIPAMVYSGKHMVRVLPAEGRFGGVVEKEYEIIVRNCKDDFFDKIESSIEICCTTCPNLHSTSTIVYKNRSLEINGRVYNQK